jgi:hypothetical protein
MSDPHKNIFYYYRGPSSRDNEDIIYDRQIEDNTTKALVNCLDYSSQNLLEHFLNYFEIEAKSKTKPQFLLQVSLSKSRPDARIKFIESSIFIENKVGAQVNKEQILNHKEELEDNDTLILLTNNIDDKGVAEELGIKYIHWNEIYQCFKAYETVNRSERFLIEQFLNYLEVIGLSDFIGFNNDDFDFFISNIEDYKPIIRNKIEKFGNLIYESLNPEIKETYVDKHIGKMSKRSEDIWFGIRKDQSIKDVLKHCNFTIEIDADSLMFNTVIRDGKYNQKKPVGVLYKRIKNDFDGFLNLLKSLNDNSYLKVFKRVPRTGKVMLPGNEIWILQSYITLEIINYETIDYFLMLLKKIEFPGIHIGLSIKRGDKVLQEPEKLISTGKQVFEEGYRILRYLES